METIDVIKKFLKYAEYDPEQHSHNVLSMKYEFHKVCEHIKGILSYDPAGLFAVLYAKHSFSELMKEAKVTVFDLLSNPDYLTEEREMWSLFYSPDVENCENDLLKAFETLINSIIPQKLLGERDREEEKNALFGAIEVVTEQLQKCHMDIFKKGGQFVPITNYSVHIHVFNRLSECLLAIEAAQDGMYLCYINEGGSVDGYFGFMIKSNGNIVFVNERIDEAYPGQHKNTRSARYSEAKQYDLFPYNFIFEYKEHDRLGYATKHLINEDKLALFNLKPKAYMPLVIAMMMLNAKCIDLDLSSMQLKYIDTLLPNSLALPTPGVEALMIPSESAIAELHREYAIELTSDDILKGTKSSEFDWRSKDQNSKYNHDEYGHFDRGSDDEYFGFKSDAELFIELYGDGFELDTKQLLESNRHLKYLTSAELAKTDETPHVEFVGTKRRMDLIAYQQGRAQLAEYIKDRIKDEYEAFGGVSKIHEWWKNALLANKEKVIEFCIAKYMDQIDSIPRGIRIEHQVEQKGRPQFVLGDRWYAIAPWNKPYSFDYRGNPTENDFYCAECQSKASLFFIISPDDWKAIESIVGEVPKIIKGWRCHGHLEHGNSILSVTDKMTGIGTPMEYHEAQWNPRFNNLRDENGRHIDTQMKFLFWIGFSKRTWAKILKERGFKIRPTKTSE